MASLNTSLASKKDQRVSNVNGNSRIDKNLNNFVEQILNLDQNFQTVKNDQKSSCIKRFELNENEDKKCTYRGYKRAQSDLQVKTSLIPRKKPS